MAAITVYPVAGAVSPCDGPVNRVSVDQTFAAIIAASGNQGGLESVTQDKCAGLQGSSTSNQFQALRRAIYNFDTSAIGSGSTITSATFSLYGVSKNNNLGSDDIHVCASTPASTSAIPASDFANVGSTSFGSVAYASWTNGAYNDFTLNGSGLAAINKTGITSLATRIAWDINASFTGAWVLNAETSYDAYYADQTGTGNDPKLVVNYTTSSGVAQTIMLTGVGA